MGTQQGQSLSGSVVLIRVCNTQAAGSGDRHTEPRTIWLLVAHVGFLFGVGGDRVVSVTWRRPSGGVTLDGESGWQKWGFWEGLLGCRACRRSLCHLRERLTC